MPMVYRSVKGSRLTSAEVDGNFAYAEAANPSWIRGLSASGLTTTAISANCTQVRVRDEAGNSTIYTGGSAVGANYGTTVGPNGRDQTAAFANFTWLYAYWIGGPGQSRALIVSSSATGPSFSQAPGYSQWAFAFYIRHASGSLFPFVVKKSTCYYVGQSAPLWSGPTTGAGQVITAYGGLVPTQANKVNINGIIGATADTNGNIDIQVNIYQGTIGLAIPWQLRLIGQGISSTNQISVHGELVNTDSQPQISHGVSVNSPPYAYLYVENYEFDNGSW